MAIKSPPVNLPSWLLILGLVAAVGLALAGCAKTPSSVAAKYQKAFDSAPPDIKANWAATVGAVNSNDYAVAFWDLRQLRLQPNLSREQSQGVDALETLVNNQMYDAASKGDPKAQEAIANLRKAFSASRAQGN